MRNRRTAAETSNRYLERRSRAQESRDGQLLFEVEMHLQKGCIMVSGVESS